jgi:hypothetical protein
MLQHSLECRDYKQHHRKLLTAGENGCVDLLTRSRNPLLTGLCCIFWWNIWKEHNRRTFQHNSLQVAEVASLITNDFKSYQDARRTTTPTSPHANFLPTGYF